PGFDVLGFNRRANVLRLPIRILIQLPGDGRKAVGYESDVCVERLDLDDDRFAFVAGLQVELPFRGSQEAELAAPPALRFEPQLIMPGQQQTRLDDPVGGRADSRPARGRPDRLERTVADRLLRPGLWIEHYEMDLERHGPRGLPVVAGQFQ